MTTNTKLYQWVATLFCILAVILLATEIGMSYFKIEHFSLVPWVIFLGAMTPIIIGIKSKTKYD